jgi:hypothetical protein
MPPVEDENGQITDDFRREKGIHKNGNEEAANPEVTEPIRYLNLSPWWSGSLHRSRRESFSID